MLTENQITYVAKDGLTFPFALSDFRRHPLVPETFNLIPHQEFLGLVINLGEPFDYCGNGFMPCTFLTGQYNLVYLPVEEYEVTIPPGLHHSIAIRLQLSTLVHCVSDFPFLLSFVDKARTKKPALVRDKPIHISPEMDSEINALLRNISRDEELRDLYAKTKCFDIFFSSLTTVAELLIPVAPSVQQQHLLVQEVVTYLEGNLDKHHTLEDLAHTFGVSERKLQQAFKTRYGKTVYEFLVQHRMSAAKTMLRDPSVSIKVIASALGYKDANNFTIAYKKYYNQVPTAVRT